MRVKAKKTGLKASDRQQLRLLCESLDSFPDFVVVTDLDGKLLFVNAACLGRFGYQAQELIGQPVAMLQSSRNPPEYGAMIHATTLSGGWAGELLDVTKAGDDVLINLRTSVLRGATGQPIAAIGISHDITERRRAERELEHERGLLHALLDTIPDTIYFKDTESRFTLINQAQAQLLGLRSPQEAVGKTDFDFFPQAQAQAMYDDENLIMTTRLPLVSKTEWLTCRDGHQRWVSATKLPLVNREGQVTGLVGISRDITQQKQFEEQMLVTQKMASVSSLASGIAHEFNNLLTGVAGYADLLLHQLPDGHPGRNAAELIQRAATEATELTKQLSIFSHHAMLQVENVRLRDIVASAFQLVAASVPTGVQFHNRVTDATLQVCADPMQLRQALVNILLNACEAMPNGGTASAELHEVVMDADEARQRPPLRPGRYALVIFRDTGEGMEPELCARAFEPFFTTKARPHHSGLGLTAAYGIVEMHNGLVQICSTPGEGTVVYVYLPVADAVAPPSPVAKTPHARNATILLVDDEEIPRLFMAEVLTNAGYRVLTANDGQAGLEVYRSHAKAIDLIVTDIVMPRLSGDAMVAEIRKLGPPVEILAVTGYTVGDAAARLRALGINGFLQKPFTGSVLLQHVRQALGVR